MNTVLNVIILAAVLAFAAFIASYFFRRGGNEEFARFSWMGAAILFVIGVLYILAGGTFLILR